MDRKKTIKTVKRYFARLALHISSLIIRFLPGGLVYGFAKQVARLGYFIAAKHRRIALEGLRAAFGSEKTVSQIKRIAKDCFIFMAESAIELMFLIERPELIKKRVSFVGKQHLEAAFSKGKGVILVSAHFGNFPLMMSRLSLEGYKIAGIMRFARDEKAEKFFHQKRLRMGIKAIYSQPRKACVEESIRTLRNNELLFVPLDQNFGTAGVFVDFFSRKAATATGPVILSQRTKAAILPCFIVRQKDDTHKIIFEPPFDLKEGKSNSETVLINIQRLTDIIESYIRKYPAEWGWIHRRWKSQINPSRQ
jgi:KDO2-lipid IV(A) lauroyltransferase